MTSLPLRVSAEESDAIASGAGVVALESTLVSPGVNSILDVVARGERGGGGGSAALAAAIAGEVGAPDRERLTARGRS